MTEETFGPFRQAANKLLKFAIDNKVPNAGKITLDGQLGAEWIAAFDTIFSDEALRGLFDYGVLREVRDDLTPLVGRWSFVGNIGQNEGHYQFIGLVQRMARQESELNIQKWDQQRGMLDVTLARLTDWRKVGELLNWGRTQPA